MTAPVDVLAVMEVAERFATAYNLPNTASDFASASAAIAELIEAAKESTAFIGYDGTGAEQVRARVYAALARVGGAA